MSQFHSQPTLTEQADTNVETYPADPASNGLMGADEAYDPFADAIQGASTLEYGNSTSNESLHQLSGARILMARKLADLIVLPVGTISANERSLAGDILLQILDKVEYPLRIDIAQRIGRVPDIPDILLRALLLDVPEVAEPVLRKAESISSSLLIECAKKGTTAHRHMMAERYGLPTDVIEVMLTHNELDVAKRVLRREEVSLSQATIELLVSRSTVDETLQELLLHRDELEPAHGFMMFWWVPTANRRRILSRFSLDRSVIQEALEGVYPLIRGVENPDPLAIEILTLNDRRHRPRGLNGEAISKDVVKRSLAIARQYPSEEIIDAIALIAGITNELAARILRDPGGEPYAVLCKSLGIPRSEFLEFLCAPVEGVFDDGGESALSPERADELLDVFDRMARDFSRAVLRYWDWNGNPRIARITKLLSENSPIIE